jgi:hypothetical protein
VTIPFRLDDPGLYINFLKILKDLKERWEEKTLRETIMMGTQ